MNLVADARIFYIVVECSSISSIIKKSETYWMNTICEILNKEFVLQFHVSIKIILKIRKRNLYSYTMSI